MPCQATWTSTDRQFDLELHPYEDTGQTTLPHVEATSPVYFPYLGSAYLTYREWMLTVTIDFTPYKEMMTRIRTELRKFEEALEKLIYDYSQLEYLKLNEEEETTKTQGNETLVYTELLDLARDQANQHKEELRLLEKIYQSLNYSFLRQKEERSDILSGRTLRGKRSFLPGWMSEGIGLITGLASKEKMKEVRNQIRILTQNNELITTATRSGMTLLNSTVIEVNHNRQGLNHLIEAVGTMEENFHELKQQIIGQLTDTSTMMVTFGGMQLSMNAVVSLIRRTQTQLLRVRSQLQAAIVGNYPIDLLNAKQIDIFADHLRDTLANTYILPYKTDELKNVLLGLPTLVVSNFTAIHIIIRLPLSVKADEYLLYSVENVPMNTTENGTLAMYKLEATALAITPSNKKYKLLSLEAAQRCAQSHVTYCSLTGPTYDISNSPTCLSSIFTKDKETVKKYCTVHPVPSPILPLIHSLNRGRWLIFTLEPIHMNLECLDYSRPQEDYVTVPPGTQLLRLPNGCRTSSRNVNLPPFIDERSEIHIQETDQALQKFHHPEWKRFMTNRRPENYHETQLEQPLPALDQYQQSTKHHLDYMHEQLGRVMQRPVTESRIQTTYKWLIIGTLIAVVIVGLITIASIYLYPYYKNRRRAMQYSPAPQEMRRFFNGATVTISGDESFAYIPRTSDVFSKKRKTMVNPSAPTSTTPEPPTLPLRDRTRHPAGNPASLDVRSPLPQSLSNPWRGMNVISVPTEREYVNMNGENSDTDISSTPIENSPYRKPNVDLDLLLMNYFTPQQVKKILNRTTYPIPPLSTEDRDLLLSAKIGSQKNTIPRNIDQHTPEDNQSPHNSEKMNSLSLPARALQSPTPMEEEHSQGSNAGNTETPQSTRMSTRSQSRTSTEDDTNLEESSTSEAPTSLATPDEKSRLAAAPPAERTKKSKKRTRTESKRRKTPSDYAEEWLHKYFPARRLNMDPEKETEPDTSASESSAPAGTIESDRALMPTPADVRDVNPTETDVLEDITIKFVEEVTMNDPERGSYEATITYYNCGCAEIEETSKTAESAENEPQDRPVENGREGSTDNEATSEDSGVEDEVIWIIQLPSDNPESESESEPQSLHREGEPAPHSTEEQATELTKTKDPENERSLPTMKSALSMTKLRYRPNPKPNGSTTSPTDEDPTLSATNMDAGATPYPSPTDMIFTSHASPSAKSRVVHTRTLSKPSLAQRRPPLQPLDFSKLHQPVATSTPKPDIPTKTPPNSTPKSGFISESPIYSNLLIPQPNKSPSPDMEPKETHCPIQ